MHLKPFSRKKLSPTRMLEGGGQNTKLTATGSTVTSSEYRKSAAPHWSRKGASVPQLPDKSVLSPQPPARQALFLHSTASKYTGSCKPPCTNIFSP